MYDCSYEKTSSINRTAAFPYFQAKSSSLLFNIALIVAIAASIVSQVQDISSFVKPVLYLSWIAFFILLLLRNKGTFIYTPFFVLFLSCVCIIFLINALGFLFFKYDVFPNNYLQVILIPLFIYFLGVQTVRNNKLLINLRIVATIYCLLAIAFAAYLQAKYFPSISNWLSSVVYVYRSKNSAAQIFGSAIFILFCLKTQKKYLTAIRFVGIAYLLLMILLLQCRTALLGILLSLIIYIFIINKNRKIKVFALFVALLAITILLRNETVNNFVSHAFFVDKYDTSNLNSFSAGRLSLYTKALKVFEENILMGIGYYYVDDLYISALASGGLISGTLIIFIWIRRVFLNVGLRKKCAYELSNLILLLTVFYFVESFFEGYPPFGPGVCSFFFWLLLGAGDAGGLNNKELLTNTVPYS